MFTRKDKSDLISAIAELKGESAVEAARLKAVTEARTDIEFYSDQVQQLEAQLSHLRIQKNEIDEEHNKRMREIEHRVGLEASRTDFERTKAIAEAKLEVEQGNLAHEQKAFKKQMDFITDRFTKEVQYLKDDILKGLLERLPTVTVDRRIREESNDGVDR